MICINLYDGLFFRLKFGIIIFSLQTEPDFEVLGFVLLKLFYLYTEFGKVLTEDDEDAGRCPGDSSLAGNGFGLLEESIDG